MNHQPKQNDTKLILRLSGKARQVFKLWDLFVQRQGNKTLGELAK